MAKGRKSSVSAKNSLSLFFLGIIVLIVLIGAFALQQKDGFSLFPRASTLSSGSTTSSYMCQEECVTNYQCGRGQICAVKPGSNTAQKFCYNPSCPENNQCGGEGCGEQSCQLLTSTSGWGSYKPYDTLDQCVSQCSKTLAGGTCKSKITHIATNPYDEATSKYYCLPNLCSIDVTNVYMDWRLSVGLSYGYVRRSEHSCPARSVFWKQGDCGSGGGFRCEQLFDGGRVAGLRVTRMWDDNGFSDADLHFKIGTNCTCNDSVNENYCQNVARRTVIDDDFKAGQHIDCNLDTLQCKGPFGP